MYCKFPGLRFEFVVIFYMLILFIVLLMLMLQKLSCEGTNKEYCYCITFEDMQMSTNHLRFHRIYILMDAVHK